MYFNPIVYGGESIGLDAQGEFGLFQIKIMEKVKLGHFLSDKKIMQPDIDLHSYDVPSENSDLRFNIDNTPKADL